MGSTSVGAAYGLQRLADATNRYFRGSIPVYYVESNAQLDSQEFAEMGFMYQPTTSSGMVLAGTTQSLVDPPPSVVAMTLKQLSDAANIAAELRMGAKIFSFSSTWVSAIQTARGYSTPQEVFNGKKVVGFLYDGLLFNFESFIHQDIYGQALLWQIICNGNEIK